MAVITTFFEILFFQASDHLVQIQKTFPGNPIRGGKGYICNIYPVVMQLGISITWLY